MPTPTIHTDLVIVGAGGCGLTAALVAARRGLRVLLLEHAAEPGGSTAMSAGLIVAAESRLMRERGVEGTADELARDVLARNGYASDRAVTQALCRVSGRVIDWLMAAGVPLEHLPNYRYEGMSQAWLHAPPSRSGVDLVRPLVAAVDRTPLVALHVRTPATGLLHGRGAVTGVAALVEGAPVRIEAPATLLAASGFGNNPALVAHCMPEMAGALYYGAPAANGDALGWARALGAATEHMTAYQGHGSIAWPELLLVTTYLINHGAIQVNRHARRFGDETQTYDRHAAAVQAQPGRCAIEIFDARILQATLKNYPRFRECIDAGIVYQTEELADLARQFELDPVVLAQTVASYNRACAAGKDEFGRTRFGAPLASPYCAVRVTSALVQTLGGLHIDAAARVLREDGAPIPGLYAGGGTAAGFAGDRPEGYLAGTGLLAAFGLGWLAGHAALADPYMG